MAIRVVGIIEHKADNRVIIECAYYKGTGHELRYGGVSGGILELACIPPPPLSDILPQSADTSERLGLI